jgi:hypothetical protein
MNAGGSYFRSWPITSFRAAHQLRRFGHEADIGFGGSRDLILDASSANWDYGQLGGSKYGRKGAPPLLGYTKDARAIFVVRSATRSLRLSQPYRREDLGLLHCSGYCER